jgi:hypothetical protein
LTSGCVDEKILQRALFILIDSLEVILLGLTKGEKKSLVFMLIAILGFMPPVTVWANRVEPFVLGMPFLLFWQSLMIFGTFVCMALAYFVTEGADKK